VALDWARRVARTLIQDIEYYSGSLETGDGLAAEIASAKAAFHDQVGPSSDVDREFNQAVEDILGAR